MGASRSLAMERAVSPLMVPGPSRGDLVCLEGHLRLTAYALARFAVELNCLIGITLRLARRAQ